MSDAETKPTDPAPSKDEEAKEVKLDAPASENTNEAAEASTTA
jgi:hypothetical protein